MTRFRRVQHKPSVAVITRTKFHILAGALLWAAACDKSDLVGVRTNGGDGAGGAASGAGGTGFDDNGASPKAGTTGESGSTAAGTSGTSGSGGSANSTAAAGAGATGEGGSTDGAGTAGEGGSTTKGGTTGHGGTTGQAGSGTGDGGSTTGEGGSGGSIVTDHVRYLYAANGGVIEMFAVEEATGQIRPRGYVLAGLSAAQVLISADQRFLFAASNNGSVGAYAIDAVSGRPTAVAGSPYAAGSGVGSAALHPSGAFLYAAMDGSDDVSAFAIDGSTGVLTPVGSPVPVGEAPVACVVSPGGGYLYVLSRIAESVYTFAIDQLSGALTPVGSPVPTGVQPTAIIVHPDGSALYVGTTGKSYPELPPAGVNSYTIDQATGQLTPAETEDASTFPSQLDTSFAMTPSGKYMLVSYLISSDLAVYETGPNGMLTIVDPDVYDVASPADVAVDHTGTRVYVADSPQKSVYSLTLDPDTGALAQVGGAVAWGAPSSLAVGHGSQPLVATSRFALVPNQDDDTVSTYDIASDGSLVATGSVGTGDNPVGVGVSLDGSLALVTNQLGNTAASYDSDPTTGALVATGSSVATGSQPLVVALDPSGRFAFTSNFGANNVSRLSVASDGTLAALGTTGTGSNPLGLAMHPTGAYLYVAERGQNRVTAYGVSSTTGALTTGGCCAQAFPGTQPSWVTVSPSGGALFVTNFGSNTLAWIGIGTINNGFGSTSTFPTGAGPFGVAVDPQEKYVFVANSGDDTVTTFQVGVGTLVNLGATPTGGLTPMTLATDGSGEHLYVVNEDSNDITVFSIDRATGDLTTQGDRVPTGNYPGTIVVRTSLE